MPRPTTSVATSSCILPSRKRLHHAVAGRLLQVAVDHVGGREMLGQPAVDLLGAALGAAEDDRLLRAARASSSRTSRSNFRS